ncbi:MAG: response regulator [Pseudomonadota bacterium]
MSLNNLMVYIIEDEPKYAEVLSAYLKRFEHRYEVITDPFVAANKVLSDTPDFVILDLNLPQVDGLDICREIRAASQIPILILTSRVSEFDRLAGLEAGADDYVCKPFSPLEVVSRINTIMRRVRNPAIEVQALTFEGLTLHLKEHTCFANDHPLNLTPVEFRLLRQLISEPRRVFTRQELHASAYPDGRIVSDKTIETHLRNLRLKVNHALPSLDVESVYGVGYKLDLAERQ